MPWWSQKVNISIVGATTGSNSGVTRRLPSGQVRKRVTWNGITATAVSATRSDTGLTWILPGSALPAMSAAAWNWKRRHGSSALTTWGSRSIARGPERESAKASMASSAPIVAAFGKPNPVRKRFRREVSDVHPALTFQESSHIANLTGMLKTVIYRRHQARRYGWETRMVKGLGQVFDGHRAQVLL